MTSDEQNQRPHRGARIFVRVLEVVVGIVLIALLTIHVPGVQRWIGKHLTDFVSVKTGGSFSVERLSFDLSGCLEMEGLEVLSPSDDSILIVDRLSLRTSIPGLLQKRIVLDDLKLNGFYGRLESDDLDLNIDFIIDAFTSNKPVDTTSSPASLTILSNSIELNDIDFAYSSDIVDVGVVLDSAFLTEGRVSINPNEIDLTRIYIGGCTTRVLLPEQTVDVSGDSQPRDIILPGLDLSSGFAMRLDSGIIAESEVHVHLGDELEVDKFDSRHLDVADIEIGLAAVVAQESRLSANKIALGGSLPNGSRVSASGKFNASPTEIVVDSLGARLNRSYLTLNGALSYPEWERLLQSLDASEGSMRIEGRIDRSDLVDLDLIDIPDELSDIERVDLGAQFRLNKSVLDLKEFVVGTAKSSLKGTGSLRSERQNWSEISWDNIVVNADLEEDIIALIQSADSTYSLPDPIKIVLNTTGRQEDFTVLGELVSPIGLIALDGSGGVADENFLFDVNVETYDFLIGEAVGSTEIDSLSLQTEIAGVVGADTIALKFEGVIDEVTLRGQQVSNANVQGHMDVDSLVVGLEVLDTLYRVDAVLSGFLGTSPSYDLTMHLDQFRYGLFVSESSDANISGDVALTYREPDSGSMDLVLSLDSIELSNDQYSYQLDSLRSSVWVSADSSDGIFVSDVGSGFVKSNFDIRLIESRTDRILDRNMLLLSQDSNSVDSQRQLNSEFEIKDASILKLLGVENEEFSGVDMSVNWEEAEGFFDMQIASGRFSGGGIELDTLSLVMKSTRQESDLELMVDGIKYDSFAIGKLDWLVEGNVEELVTRVVVANDSIVAFGANGALDYIDRGFSMLFDSLVLLDQVYENATNGTMYVAADSLSFDSLYLLSEGPSIRLNGNRDLIQAEISRFALTSLNYFIDRDTNLIERGTLTMEIDYDPGAQNISADVLVDSLIIGTSSPLSMEISGANEGTAVPFVIEIRGDSNRITGNGVYEWEEKSIESEVLISLNQLSAVEVFLSDVFERIDGSVNGTASVSGTTDKIEFDGALDLNDVLMELRMPQTTLFIENEAVVFDEKGINLTDFKVTDGTGNPLSINGELRTEDYREFQYFLDVTTDRFTLLDNKSDKTRSLQGLFVVASDIELRGDSRDATVNATVVVDPSTDFTLVMPEQEVELMTSDGIVEFVDPNAIPDSLSSPEEMSFIDSLMSDLPDLDITASVKLQEDAKFTIVLDPVSGDLIQARGNADLKMRYDRTGNAQLNGAYEIKDGYYELSFYDIVRKRFELVDGSRVDWSGIAEEGTMNITARQTIKTSSIGLVGHEVGEDQRSIYRRSLPYEVSIFIRGQLDAPEISFGLDLPNADKASFPVLASKLSRLSQPEFESELNKQVFGLLVLGGFIPQTSGSDFDEMAVATTAIANSVNGLLTAQLNRLTNKIEGVDINIGLQSYTDYQTGAGNATRTAMDFRVSKRLMEDRLTIEVGGEVDLYNDQSGVNTGDGFRGDVAVIYDLTESGNKKLKAFNNETYDIIYHEVRNTGIALIFIREFDKGERRKKDKE